jgi:hypothetical protein
MESLQNLKCYLSYMGFVLKSKQKLSHVVAGCLAFLGFGIFMLIRGHWMYNKYLFCFILLFISIAIISYLKYRVIAYVSDNYLIVNGYWKTIKMDIDTIDMIKMETDFFCRLHNIKKLVVKSGNTEKKLYIPDFNPKEFENFFRVVCPELFPYRKENGVILN